jgi:hypothetical protein
MEKHLHAQFAGSHIRGEWFRYPGAVKAFLDGLPWDERDGGIGLVDECGNPIIP